MSSNDLVKSQTVCMIYYFLNWRKNMALSVNELDLINFREPKFVYLHIKLTENENSVCLCGRNQFGLLCTWYRAK